MIREELADNCPLTLLILTYFHISML